MAESKKPMSFDEWANAGGGAVKPVETGLAGRAGDLGLSMLKGAVAVPEAAVGVADLVTGGKAGKKAEELGFRPKEAKGFLDSLKSDAAKDAQYKFENAEGFTGKFGAAVQNPSLITNAIAESVPLMGAGGVVGRGLMAAAPRIGGAGAAAIGEGAVGAGSAAEGIRQETPDGELTGTQSLLAAGSGAATGLLGLGGAKAAKALGVGDIDQAIVGGTTKVAGQAGKEAPGMFGSMARGALSEGVFEELPQSLSEQAIQNVALDRPWTQDLDAAAAMGLLTGGAMGGGMGLMSRQDKPAQAQPAAAPDAPVQPPVTDQLGQSLTGTPMSSLMAGGGLTGAANPLGSTGNLTTTGSGYPGMNTAGPDSTVDPETGAIIPAEPGIKRWVDPNQQPVAPAPLGGGLTGSSMASMMGGSDGMTGAQLVPIKPSEQMGLNPADGPLSAAAVTAVNGTATPSMQAASQATTQQEQATQAQQQADDKRKSSGWTMNEYPVGDEPMVASFESKDQALFMTQATADDGTPTFNVRDTDWNVVASGNTFEEAAGRAKVHQASGGKAVQPTTGATDGVTPAQTQQATTQRPEAQPAAVTPTPDVRARNLATLKAKMLAGRKQPDAQAAPIQPGSQAADAGTAPVAQGPEGASGGLAATGEAAVAGQSESAQSLTDAPSRLRRIEALNTERSAIARQLEAQGQSIGDDPLGKAIQAATSPLATRDADWLLEALTYSEQTNRTDIAQEVKLRLTELADKLEAESVTDSVTPGVATDNPKYETIAANLRARRESKGLTADAIRARLKSQQAGAPSQPGNFSATPTATVGTQTNVQAGPGFTGQGIAAEMAALKARNQPAASQQAQPQIFTGKSALFDGYGASVGSVEAGDRKQLMVDPNGGYFWGDWKQESQRDVGAVAGGADKDATPASFTSSKEARQAAASTPLQAAQTTPSQPAQQQQAKPRTKPQPLLNDTEAAVTTAEKLPPTDIKLGDKVMVDGKPFTVTQGVDGGIAAESDATALGDGVTAGTTRILKGDDAIRAKIEADKAGLNKPAKPKTEKEAKAATDASERAGTVSIPPSVDALLTQAMEAQKGRITRLRNQAKADGTTLEERKAANLKVLAAEATLRKMRTTRFDAEDAVAAAMKSGNAEDARPIEDLFPKAFAEVEALLNTKADGAAQESAAPSDDLNAMFDDVLAEEVAKDEAKNAKPTNLKQAITQQRAKRAPRTATQAATSAAKNTASALGNAIDGLGALFGGNGKLGSGLSFDEQTYAKAKPLFQAAVANLGEAGRDMKEAMRAVVRMVMDKFGAQAAQNMKPYVVRFIEDTSQENLDTTTGQADTDTATNTKDGEYDANRDDSGNDGPLADIPPGSPEQDSEGGATGSGDGVRGPDTAGNGQPEGDRTGRGNGVGGGQESLLPDSPAEIRPAADGPVGKKQERPAKLTGENPGNFVIPADFKLGSGTDGQKIEANMQAIRTLRAIQKEGRYATKDEQAIMARYVGWGGLKPVFDPKHTGSNNMFGRAQRELKATLTPSEYRAAAQSVRNAHYTADGVVHAMWRIARFMGFNGGRVLEPTVGIGNFIGLQPAGMAASSEWHASELDAVTSQMAAMVYPEASILTSTGFQAAPFADGVFDLAIGNPPFGGQTITDKKRKALDGMKIHNYIIGKTGMHLRPGGVMSMVVTHRFLDTADPEVRNVLAGDFKFLGAFRLPNNAFAANAGTEVVTDVVFLQKLRDDEPRNRDASWLDVNGTVDIGNGQTARVNRYYQENPSHILGRSAMDGTMYAGGQQNGGEYTVHGDGRDIGQAIDALMETGLSGLKDVLVKTNQDKQLAPAMLKQSDLPVGGLMVDGDGKIFRRDLDDERGNAVIEEITPETLWKDQAAQWSELNDAIAAVKKLMQEGGRLTTRMAHDFLESARFVFKADGGVVASPTKADQAVYDLVDAMAKPALFSWKYDEQLLEVTKAMNRRKLGDGGYKVLGATLGLRNRTLALIGAEISNADNIEELRADLNKAYDAFVAKHGYLSDPKNAKYLGGDVGAEAGLESAFQPEVSAAVSKSNGIPQRKASADKADILKTRVNFPYKEITKADSSADALSVSLSERGKVDLRYMAGLTGKTVEQVIKDLTTGDNPQLFMDMETGQYQEAERFLSGNVRHKLDEAQRLGAPKYVIAALEKAQPAPKKKADVTPNIRGGWMPGQIFEDFLVAMGVQKPHITSIASQGILKVDESASERVTEFGRQFVFPGKSIAELFNAAASGKAIVIGHRDQDGKFHKNEEQTKRVNAIVERMAKSFAEWAYTDDSRAKQIVDAYNDKMNTHVPRTYDGSKYLKTVGASPSVNLRRTQKNAAWRMIQDPRILMDHVVGAGKTYTLITGVMERRRLGLTRKPMIAVPNHLVVQWARDFYKLYPGAKVLAATPDDFTKKNRRRLFARIATGDYDAIIVGHSSLGFMETPAEDMTAIIDEKLAGLREALEVARKNNDSKRTLGQIEDRIDAYEKKLDQLKDRPVDEIGIDFKRLGVDYLAVDEAHEFKNLEYATSGERVVGMNDPAGSKKAFDLYAKIRGLQARGGGVAFATGTPVSNSLVEVYTVLSYMAHDELLLRNQEHFDAWSGSFLATETRMEYTATGIKPRRVLSGLINLDGLRQLYEQFTDIISMADLKRIYAQEVAEKNKETGANERTEFPVPKVMGGGRQLNSGPITDAQREYMDYLVARMEAVEASKGDKDYMRIDNALYVLTDARKMSLDIRTVAPTMPRDQNGKVMRAAKSIRANYDKWDADRGTQMVFCDLSTPAKSAQKDAQKMLNETALVVFGKDGAKSFKQRVTGMSFEKQWADLTARAEQITDDPETDEATRDKITTHLDSIEDAEATMSVADIGFSVYDDLRQVLVDGGIPESEIAFIHDYETPEKKAKLFDRMNNGYIRVLIGSSRKMGAGTNAQERLVALHHMDAPWRPSDVEQREGRIIRQGNMFYKRDPDGFEVSIEAYSTDGTSDTVMWQVLERKARAIEQFRAGGITASKEESNDSDQYADFMASSTGNPVFKLKLEAERDYIEAASEVGGALMVKSNAQAFMRDVPKRIARLKDAIESASRMSVDSISFQGESGTAQEFEAVMAQAMDQYALKMQDYQPKKEAAQAALTAWENEIELTRGDKPKMPTPPSRPTPLNAQIREKSGYARAIYKALATVKRGEPVVIQTSGDPIMIKGLEVTKEDTRWTATMGKSDSWFASSVSGKATDAANLAEELMPSAIRKMAAGIDKSAKSDIHWLEERRTRASKEADIEVDTSKRDRLQQLFNWYSDLVTLAERAASIARGAKTNRFIAKDRKRNLNSGTKVSPEASVLIAFDGVKYATTGVQVASGQNETMMEAVGVQDGEQAIIVEKRDGGQSTYTLRLKPGKRQKPAASTNIKQTGAPEANETDVVFSRARPVFSRAAQGQASGAVQGIVDAITARWANAPKVVVAFDMNDPAIPERVRQEDQRQRSGGATGTPEGFYYKGTVYLMSSKLAKPGDVVRVLFHESLGHFGLRGVFGKELKPLLQQIATMRKSQIEAKMKEYGLRGVSSMDRLVAAEEVLAEMAQSSPTIGFVRRAVATIKAWLRKNIPGFMGMNMSDDEIITQFILPARAYVVNGGPNGGPGGVVRFSRDSKQSKTDKRGQTETPQFRAWFKDSKVVGADGKPLVVYHGTGADITEFSMDAAANERAAKVTGVPGFYFSPSPDVAGDYAFGKDGANVMPSYLALRNPKEVVYAELIGGTFDRASLEAQGHDGLTVNRGGKTWAFVAFNPTQIKSAIGNNGEFDPATPDIRFSRAAGNTPPTVAQDTFSIKGATSAQLAHYRGMGMQVLGRRQIVDLYGDMLPELKAYDSLVQKMDADKNESGAEADALVSDWAKLDERSALGFGAAKNPGMERKLAELMHDATLAQIDPDKPIQKGDDSAQHAVLAGRFNALSPKAQEVYRTARDMYADHFKKVQEALQERIQRSGMDETSKAKMIAKMDADLFNKLKGVYFPLARFGKYVVVSKNEAGETVSVSRAETLAEANKMRREVVKNSPQGVTVSRVYKDAEFNASRDAVGKGFVSDLMTMLQGQGVGEDVLDSVGQLYLSSLPDLSWAKHGIHRKGTPGFSQDARRAFAQNMFHGARHLAKLRYSDQLADKLMDMENRVKDQRDDEDFDQIKAQQVVDEMNARHETLMNPKTSSLSTALTSVGFVWFLGISPASAMVNLSQTALVAYPVMAAKWGFQKAGAALLSASVEVVRAGNDLSKVLKGDELAAFQKAVDDGTIDVTQAHDLAGVAQGEDERVAMAMRPVMRAASFMFHHAEKFNRQATFIAAYRLAKENGVDADKAFEQAKKATYDAHFDYSAGNRPRIMQGNWQKVLFLFKQYGQNMVYTLTRQAYLSMKGMTPEQRTEARKQLGGLLAMHAMAAGALGLPLVGVLLSAASMAGGDDDEPWDAEVALKNMMADAMGPKAAEVMAHGLSRLTPWDLSGRVALNKLILPDIQEGLEGQPLWEKMVTAAAGPVAGIGGGFVKGMAEMGQGQYQRGLESMLPVALKNTVKAMRFGEEGAVDKTGVVIKDEVGASGVIGQALGFRPSDVALATEGKTAIYQADKALTERRSNLVRLYAMSRMNDDSEGTQDALDQVRQFNEKNPNRRITMPNLMQSVRNRQRRIDDAEQGVYLPKNRRDALEAGRFAMAD